MDLTGQVLEEALEFLPVAVGGRQEVGRIDLVRVEFDRRINLGAELPAESFDPAPDLDHVAALEAEPDPVDLAEQPGRDRPAAVTQLQAQVGRSVARGQPVLAGADVAAREGLPGRESGDLVFPAPRSPVCLLKARG